MKNYYGVLGVSEAANESQIKTAYREAIRREHPDLNRAADATRKAQELNEAYSVLSNSIRKAEYDQLRVLQRNVKSTQVRTEPAQASRPAAEATARCQCQKCGANDETLRVVVLTWVISLILISFRRGWASVLCRKCQIKYVFLFNLELAFLGIWSIPWGILWSFAGVVKNLGGGIQPVENNVLLLNTLGLQFYREGKFRKAAEAYRASLAFQKDPKIAQALKECEARVRKTNEGWFHAFMDLHSPTWVYNYILFLIVAGIGWLVAIAMPR